MYERKASPINQFLSFPARSFVIQHGAISSSNIYIFWLPRNIQSPKITHRLTKRNDFFFFLSPPRRSRPPSCPSPSLTIQPDELHYAELSITMPRNYASGGSGGAMICQPGVSTAGIDPPAYEYFVEPTVYAQIDHFKTMPRGTMVTSPAGHIITPSSSYQGPMASMPHHTMAAHTLAHPSHHHQMAMHMQQSHPQQQQQQQQHIQLQQTGAYATAGGGHGPGASVILKQSPTTYQTIVNHTPHQTQLGVAGTPVGTAATAATAQNPYGSREIVTVRTPLLYSQQESCV